MNIQQAQQIKRSLETFFYKVRFNIGLHNIIASSQYSQFKKTIESAMHNQILYFAKFEKVNDIIGLAKASRTLGDKELSKNLDKIWLAIFDIIETEEIKIYFRWASDRGGQIGVNKLKISDTFNLTNKKLLQDLNVKIDVFLHNVDSTTKSWIARTVEEGLRDAYSIIDIAKTIRDESLSLSRTRAQRIAEHESALLLGDMALEVFNRSGVEFHKWITSRDERVCIVCAANEQAGEVRVGLAFPSGGISTPAHVGCRCFTLPVIADKPIEIWLGE